MREKGSVASSLNLTDHGREKTFLYDTTIRFSTLNITDRTSEETAYSTRYFAPEHVCGYNTYDQFHSTGTIHDIAYTSHRSTLPPPARAGAIALRVSVRSTGDRCPPATLELGLSALARGEKQAAYNLLVASTPEALAAGSGICWDSGRVDSAETVQIAYAGMPLASRQRCYWAVRCWDRQGGVTPWSTPASFEMGLLEPEEWQGLWIGTEETLAGPLLRRDFTVTEQIVRARVYICGLGYYELRLNGRKVGDHVLDPNWTDYDHREFNEIFYPYDDDSRQRVLYVTYDITDMLQPGANAVGVMLGNGWHNQRRRLTEGNLSYGPPRLLLQLEVDYADGRRAVVVTDETWRCAGGPIVADNIYIGERYDARLEQPGWDSAGFNAERWLPVLPAPRPAAPLVAQMSPPDRVVNELAPVSRQQPEPRVFVFDFGVNFAGWVRLRVQGPAGSEVTLRFAEEIHPDGTLFLDSTNGLGSPEDQIQHDVYTLNGRGEECYAPRFTWHAFRYVEVAGYPGIPPLSALEGCVVHSAMNPAGEFSCADEMINAVQTAYRRTQQANYHSGVPSDCPHRERLGYTGDGQLTTEAAMFNFDAAAFYTKWLRDIADAQNRRTGFVPHTAPFAGGGGGPAWGSALSIVAWQLYRHYADRRVLEENYAGMVQWLAYLGTCTDDGGIVVHEEPGSWCLGDWSLPGPLLAMAAEGVDPPPALVNTAYYGFCARLLARIAAVLGKKEEAGAYAEQAESIAQNFHRRFFDPARGCYGSGRRGADAFALALGAVPPAEHSRVLASLLGNIDANDGHLDTGILGTPLLLEALAEHGHGEVAWRMLTKTDYPSYGFMIANGATTLWENWASEEGSHCHPMYGSVSAWFYTILAGLRLDDAAPGYRHFTVRPHFLGDLASASATVATLRGPLAVAWQRAGETLTVTLTVPAGSTCTLMLPLEMARQVWEGEELVWDNRGFHAGIAGIDGVRIDGDQLSIEIGGGEYCFKATARKFAFN